MKLCICIPTVVGREKQFEYIYTKLQKQVMDLNLLEEVTCVAYRDDKEISIGAKRNAMYKASNALFTVMIDDDDDVVDDYIETIYNAILEHPDVDCIGYVERCVMDGQVRYSKISNRFNDWATTSTGYERTPFFKVPIRTELCNMTGVEDMRFGEDHDFARRIKPLIINEYYIDKVMYLYTADSLTTEEHNKRYGITN